MQELTQPQFLKQRQQTDDSLTDERGRTDESFEKHTDRAEGDTNMAVSRDRRIADEARHERRKQSDLTKDVSNQVQTERRSEDVALKKERLDVDFVIESERSLKEGLMSKLVGQERKATDKNLLGERTQTDIVVQQAKGMLTVERAAHTSTKAELTTRDEFLAIVSHDLRNPIGAISSCTEMLLEDAALGGFSIEAKQWIGFIKRNADSSLRLISDILDMERIAEGKLQLDLAERDLNEIIKESLESHSHVATAKTILLRCISSGSAGKVFCDRDRVAQVLSNLISNALKFTPEGGAVSISLLENENEFQISVRDTGPGIPEEQKSRIFERYAQLQNKDRRGLGLGLYISQKFIEAHHGKIWVNSENGKGSTFFFSLPKSNPAGA